MATVDPTLYSQFLVSPRIPPELVLKTIQYLPFEDGKMISTLRCAHPRLWDIFKTYERSITGSFMRRELRHAQTDFPCEKEAPNLRWLVECVKRYDIVDDIMDALFSERNCFAVARHNLSLVNAGVLLSYRLVSFGQSWQEGYLCIQTQYSHPHRRPRRQGCTHNESPAGCTHGNLSRPSSRHALSALPRLRLDSSANLWPIHGRQPIIAPE